jgi:hypothetical protein
MCHMCLLFETNEPGQQGGNQNMHAVLIGGFRRIEEDNEDAGGKPRDHAVGGAL